MQPWLGGSMIVTARRWLPALVALAALAACKKSAPPAAPGVPEVEVQQVQVRDAPVEIEATGEVRGGEDVEVRARIAGFLQSIDYREGSVVRRGDLLFRIDPRTFEAAVVRDSAQVAQARAVHDRAVVQVNRLRPLVAANAVAKQDLDNALAAEASSRANVAAAQAELTTARLDLSYTRVTSPLTGLAGIRQVDVGTYVGAPEPTVLAVVSSLDPIRFDFTISETDYLTFARTAKARGLSLLQSAPPLTLTLTDGTVHPYKGRMTVVGRGISTETGTLPLQAMFPNPSGVLRPGQFGRVRLPIETIKNAIVIPQRAVQELQGTYNVFVVGSDSVAQIRAITVGIRIDSSWVVSDGLEPTDWIVVEGLQKVRSGGKVKPVPPAVAANASAAAR
ncbi:MAG: efflux RND transporter periplasmic adaptor subunit [Gemmatimonadaceae bacterium]